MHLLVVSSLEIPLKKSFPKHIRLLLLGIPINKTEVYVLSAEFTVYCDCTLQPASGMDMHSAGTGLTAYHSLLIDRIRFPGDQALVQGETRIHPEDQLRDAISKKANRETLMATQGINDSAS